MELSSLLSWIVFTPALAAIGLLGTDEAIRSFGGRGLPEVAWRGVSLGAAGFTFAISLFLWLGFDPTNTSMQFVEWSSWVPDWGIHYFLGIDGIGLLMILLTTFLVPIVLLASWSDITTKPRGWIVAVLMLETGMLGAFAALNLFLFYLFWELLLIPMIFIIGVWGGERRVYAAVKFFLFTLFGSLLMLVAILALAILQADQFGVWNLDLVAAPGTVAAPILDIAIPVEGVWWQTQGWLFVAFFLAFGIKVPIVPFHTWLPDAHVEAPTGGSVLLAGVLLKLGTYGFVRFALPLFPVAAVEAVPWVFGLGLTGILYGSLVAMVQQDVKKLVAYTSVAHLGFVMLGMFALNAEGLEGSVLQMVNHGLSTGALFLLVGMIYGRRHTRQIEEFGGIARPMPVFAALFTIVVMSSIGLPMLNGFVGEFLILLGTFQASPAVAVPATFGVVLAAVTMLWMLRRVAFGPVSNPENRGLIDLDLREKVVIGALLVPIVWIGVYPLAFLKPLQPSVLELLRTMEARSAALERGSEGSAVARAQDLLRSRLERYEPEAVAIAEPLPPATALHAGPGPR